MRTVNILLMLSMALNLCSGCATVITGSRFKDPESAKKFITEYEQSNFPEGGVRVGGGLTWEMLTADDTEFTTVEPVSVTYTSYETYSVVFKAKTIKYSDLGEMKKYYSKFNWITPFTGFIFCPGISRISESNGVLPRPLWANSRNDILGDTTIIDMRHRGASALLSLLPVCLTGAPFWWKTSEQRFLEALAYMKEHNTLPKDKYTSANDEELPKPTRKRILPDNQSESEVNTAPASFSNLKAKSASLAVGESGSLSVTLSNDSEQDWPEQTYSVRAVVSQGGKVLRKTSPITIKKPIAAGSTKEISLRVGVPPGVSGEISFQILLLDGKRTVLRSELVKAEVVAEEEKPAATEGAESKEAGSQEE
ncbi:MAG: hypothetical protein NTY77_06345 [Elusimicrobia bacterium]|nr:hypothetical protein [Elusimicrobiota bacterium]